jgi:hypothetical protein
MRGIRVRRRARSVARRGAATLDYVLILGTLIPLCGIAVNLGERIIRSAYEMISTLVSGPFL